MPDGFPFFLSAQLQTEIHVGLQSLPSPNAEGCGPCHQPCYTFAISLQCSTLLGAWVLLESSYVANEAPFLL